MSTVGGIWICHRFVDALLVQPWDLEAKMTPVRTRTCSDLNMIFENSALFSDMNPKRPDSISGKRLDCVVSFILLLMVTSGCHCVLSSSVREWCCTVFAFFVSCWSNCNKQNVTCEYNFSIMGLSKASINTTLHRRWASCWRLCRAQSPCGITGNGG